MEIHIFKQYYGVRQYFIVYRFVSGRKRQLVIEQTPLLSTVFLCSEFKIEFFICRSLFLRMAGKIAKIRTRKNFVPHGRSKSTLKQEKF